MTKVTINNAAIKSAEILYTNYVDGDTSNAETLLYVLLAICSIGLDGITRYKDMFASVLADYENAEAFKATYEIPANLIYDVGWPEVAMPVQSSMNEAELLSNKKALRIRGINKKRDTLIDSGFTYSGNEFQSKASDRENIMGVSIAAKMAIEAGAQPGNYRWANPDSDFVWITTNNTLVQMDAFDVLGLYQAGMQFKSNLTFKARQMKDDILEFNTLEGVLSYKEVW
jgi:hypothetical protein